MVRNRPRIENWDTGAIERYYTDEEWISSLQRMLDDERGKNSERERLVRKCQSDVERMLTRQEDLLDTIVNMKRAIKLQNDMIARIIQTCRLTGSANSKKKSSPKSAKATPSARPRARVASR